MGSSDELCGLCDLCQHPSGSLRAPGLHGGADPADPAADQKVCGLLILSDLTSQDGGAGAEWSDGTMRSSDGRPGLGAERRALAKPRPG